MLDTSRHFYPVQTIKEILDSLAAAKFNAFHWHAVDDDSFPITLASFPNVTENGAFSAEEVYTVAMIKDVVDYASKLAIRVIPEFDNPGHLRAIGYALRDITLCFSKDWHSTVPGAPYKINGGPPTGVLDPSKVESYELL